jgi:protein-L-isoaspartate(D-aspartate) O-methyltransferase
MLLTVAWWLPSAVAQDDAYRKARLKMVEERVEREGIRNEAVLNAVRQVPRHLFVSSKLRAHAYSEEILDIGYKQTLSTAYIVSYMTEAIEPRPTDRVLEIGTGSGYQAAVLSKLVKEVYTIEIVKPLGESAAERLKSLGYTNVKVKVGDGFKGWPEYAPFDKILVTCSPESVPQPLLDQLREGGKLIIPLGERYQQAFYLFEKKDGSVVKTRLLPTLFVPMTGIAEDQRKARPDRAHPRIVNGGFEEITDGAADGWFYQRQATLEQGKAPEGKHYLTFTNREPGRDAHVLQALGIDGSRVRSLRISLMVKAEDAVGGVEKYERPGLVILFFDADNRKVGEGDLGPWLGTFAWRRFTAPDIRVPKQTHMAMIQIGLRGATGRLSVDDVRLTPHSR